MGGTSFYLGDMQPYNTPSDLFESPGYAAGLFGRYNASRHLSFRANMMYAFVQGENTGPYEMPNNHDRFETHLGELALLAEVNFLPFVAGDPQTPITTYIMGGTGAMFYQQPLKQNNKIRSVPLILGVGFKINFTNRLSGGIEWAMRRTADELDGVYLAQDYPEVGIPDHNDWYSFTGFTLSLMFRDRTGAHCPD